MSAPRKPIQMVPAKGREDVLIPPQGLCSGTSLRKAARRVSLLYDGVIAPTGLRSTQMAVLIHVGRHQDPTMGELASYLVLDRSALAENLKPLIREGWIEVRACEQDKRVRRVCLTEAGYTKLNDSMPLWRIAQRRFEAAFGCDAAEALRQGLRTITADEFLTAFDGAKGD